MIKPQYVDHIPKAVRGNVLEVLKQRDQKDLLPRLLQELDLQQVWMCGGRCGEKCGKSVGTDTERGFLGAGPAGPAAKAAARAGPVGMLGGKVWGLTCKGRRTGRGNRICHSPEPALRHAPAPCDVTGH